MYSEHQPCLSCVRACMRAQLLQLCPTLCDPRDCSPPGFSVHGILQARILDLLHPVIKPASPASPALQAESLPLLVFFLIDSFRMTIKNSSHLQIETVLPLPFWSLCLLFLFLDFLHWKESEVTQSCLTLCDPWTVAYQAPLSMEFSRQEYWSGLPLPSLGHLPDPRIESGSPALQADALPSEPSVIWSLKMSS